MVVIIVSARGPIYTPPTVDRLTDRFRPAGVSQGYNVLYGGHNIQLKNNGSSADLVLDKSSGTYCTLTDTEVSCSSPFVV